MQTDSQPPVGEPFSAIPEALEDLRQGRIVIVCDDEGRENEGDLTSECMTGDTFRSLRCAALRLRPAARGVAGDDRSRGAGVVVYLAQEGRGIGLLNKLRAYSLQDDGLDTVDANLALGFPADLRDYGVGAQILVDLGLSTIRLLTNNPKKILGIHGFGLTVTEQVPIVSRPTEHNERYLHSKVSRLGHALDHAAAVQRVSLPPADCRRRSDPRTTWHWPTAAAAAALTPQE